MLIISARDNENKRWKKTTTTINKDGNEQRGDTSYSENVRAKWFFCTFKLAFLQSICNASLIVK